MSARGVSDEAVAARRADMRALRDAGGSGVSAYVLGYVMAHIPEDVWSAALEAAHEDFPA